MMPESNSRVTCRPSERMAPWCIHCQTWARQISAVAVFHQIVNGHAAIACEPGIQILQAYIDVPLQSVFRNGSPRRAKEVLRGNIRRIPTFQLIGKSM